MYQFDSAKIINDSAWYIYCALEQKNLRLNENIPSNIYR